MIWFVYCISYLALISCRFSQKVERLRLQIHVSIWIGGLATGKSMQHNCFNRHSCLRFVQGHRAAVFAIWSIFLANVIWANGQILVPYTFRWKSCGLIAMFSQSDYIRITNKVCFQTMHLCSPKQPAMINIQFYGYFSCEQAALRTLLSVRPSVCLSVCLSVTPFSQRFSHCFIMKFPGVITTDKNDVHAKSQSHMSKVKVTDVKANFVPIWAFPNCNSSLNFQIATKWTKLEGA